MACFTFTLTFAFTPHILSSVHSFVSLREAHCSLLGTNRNFINFTIYNGPTNALVCNKTLIQMSHTKTFKVTPTCFDRQMIIIRELFDPG
jgi:predicted O-linked N-acetylglucosamine transferase (SPINDLY family)